MQPMRSDELSFPTRTMTTTPEPLNMRWKVLNLVFHKPISVGLPMVIQIVSSITAFSTSYIFKFLSKHNTDYEKISDFYDHKFDYYASQFYEIIGKAVFENKIVMKTINMKKEFPGDLELEGVRTLMEGDLSKKECNSKNFYENTKNGICHGYAIFVCNLIQKLGVRSAVDLLKKREASLGAPLEAACYQFVMTNQTSIKKRRIDLIEKILNGEIVLSDKEAEFSLLLSLSNREKLLLELLLIEITKYYEHSYQGRKSKEEIIKKLVDEKDFCGLLAMNYKQSTFKLDGLSEQEIQRLSQISNISWIIQNYLLVEFPLPGNPMEGLYYRLEDLEKVHGNRKPCRIRSDSWYISRARTAFNFLKENRFGLTERESLAIRYVLSMRCSLYKKIEPKEIEEMKCELLGREDYVSNGLNLINRAESKVSSDEENIKISALFGKLEIIIKFIQNHDDQNFIKDSDDQDDVWGIRQFLNKKFFEAFPEQEYHSVTRSQFPIYSKLNMKILERVKVNTNNFKELDRLSKGIWLISCYGFSAGHAMAYIKMEKESIIFDPNIGFISLENNLEDHKKQILKLYQIYKEEFNLNSFIMFRIDFNLDEAVSVEELID